MNIMHKFSALVISVTFIFIIYVMYLMYYPVNVLEFNTPIYEILTPIVRKGGIVKFRVDLVKHNALPATHTRQLIDGYTYIMTTAIANAPKGKVDFIASQKLPDYIETGKYYIKSTYTYEINKLRTVTYSHRTGFFEVIK